MLLSTVLKNPVSQDTLKLTITDKDTSDPLVASVTIGEETKDSGIDGVVQFTLAYGDYEATIECEGYTTATEELAFRSNHKNFTVELEAAAPVVTTGTVTVTCQDAEETPIESADVRLWDTDTFTDPTHMVGAVWTDSNGTGTLKTLDGSYEPTSTVAEIDFGTYYFNVEYTNGEVPLYYTGEFVVDSATETVTLTLTEGGD